MTTLQEYVQQMMGRSTADHPIRRLSGLGLFARPEGMRIFRGPHGLTSSWGPNVSPLEIAELLWRGDSFVVDTRRTMNDLLMLVQRTKEYNSVGRPYQIARTAWLNAASRVPGNPFAVVLSEALARTYWIPGDLAVDREAFIRRAFGDVHAQVMALDGRATKTQASYAGIGMRALKGTTGTSSQQYRIATQAGEAWTAYTAADVLGHRERLLSGEIALATPLSVSGTNVTIGLLNPTRLKPGREIAVFDRGLDKIGNAALGDFGYDDARDMVTARVSTTGRARSSLGFRELHRTAGTQATFILAEVPFTGVKNSTHGHWARPKDLPAVVREVPLAIALAGAPTRD